jgi:Nucleotidyltransferase domain
MKSMAIKASLARPDLIHLRHQVEAILSAGGVSFEGLLNSSSEVIVFGSRAVGLSRTNSDLDLLVLGPKRGRIKSKSIDLISIPQGEALSHRWRRTELFGHIDAYGVSLMHSAILPIRATHDEHAASHKQGRICSLVQHICPAWNVLSYGLKLKYFTKLRREVQRYRLLSGGRSVPATALLDAEVTSRRFQELILEDLVKIVAGAKYGDERIARLFADEYRRFHDRLIADSLLG